MSQPKIKPIPLTLIDSSTFTGSYQAINSSGLPQPCNLLRIVNDTGVDVTISYDGVIDHDYLYAGATLVLDGGANGSRSNYNAAFAIGTIVYVKAASDSGNVYLAGYYQPF